MSKPYFCRNSFLIDWRHKRLKNKIDLLLFYRDHFMDFRKVPSLSLCTVFDSTSSNIDLVLSINPTNNVLVFGDFNVHHKNWLT